LPKIELNSMPERQCKIRPIIVTCGVRERTMPLCVTLSFSICYALKRSTNGLAASLRVRTGIITAPSQVLVLQRVP
jgi:hypothetical protein